MSQEEFIKQCKIIHNNKYDYSKVKYINLNKKILVICPIHGEFEVQAYSHLHGTNCAKCRNDKLSKSSRLTTEKFIEKAKLKFGNKYDYSKVQYVDLETKITIICPIHGEFQQTPNNHLKSKLGCPKCSYLKLSKQYQKSQDQFINDAKNIHGNKYNYSKVNYQGSFQKVCIICPEHGEFWQLPANHLQGQNCPKCQESSGEGIIRKYFEENNIKYIFQYKIPIDCNINSSGFAYIDFYLPDYDIFIEYNGRQHYSPIKKFGGELSFNNYQIPRDNYIKQYCANNNKKLIEIKYNHNIINELNNLFLKL